MRAYSQQRQFNGLTNTSDSVSFTVIANSQHNCSCILLTLQVYGSPLLLLRRSPQQLKVKAALPAEPHFLRVINQQLWCYCRGVGIVVLDPEQLQQLHTLAADDRASYGWVHDVAELDCSGSSSGGGGGGGGDVVLATKHGLYHADASGNSAIMLIDICVYALRL